MAKITAEQLRLYAVSGNSWLKPGETLVQIAEQLLRHGVTCWQLRDKQATHEEIVFQTQQILPIKAMRTCINVHLTHLCDFFGGIKLILTK